MGAMIRRRTIAATLTATVTLALLGAACTSTEPAALEPPPVEVPTVLVGRLPLLEPAPLDAGLPVRLERYDLGVVELADGAPAPLRGILARPAVEGAGSGAPSADAPPLIVVLHGSHPICRDDRAAYGSWPCPDGTEIENETGLAWLLEALAARGSVAIAPAVNVQHTLGAGEPAPAVRTAELVARTLAAIEDGRIALPDGAARTDRLVLVGHSSGGEDAKLIAARRVDAVGVTTAVVGLVMVQPAGNTIDSLAPIHVPTAILVSECDGDVGVIGSVHLSERLAIESDAPFALVLLEGGSHNATNSLLGPDLFPIESPTCEERTLARREGREDWEVAATSERARLARIIPGLAAAVAGRDGSGWAARVFDEPRIDAPGVTLTVVPAGARIPTHPLRDVAPDEVVDASVTDGLAVDGARVTRCPAGYYTPLSLPGSEVCHRPELPLLIGRPLSLALAWDRAGASVTLPVSGRAGEVLRLRMFPDPADLRLGDGPIVLRVRAQDGSSVDVELAVPPTLRFSVPPFELAGAFLPWHTERFVLGADLAEVTLEVVSPASGTLQLVSLGVD